MNDNWISVKDAALYLGMSHLTLKRDLRKLEPVRNCFSSNGHKLVTKVSLLDVFMEMEDEPK